MKRKRILFCETNVDGTIGGSYFSLLYLVEGLDKDRYEPLVVFYRENAMIPKFRETGAEIRVLSPPTPILLSRREGSHLNLPLRLVQKALNLVRFFLGRGVRLAVYLRQNRIDLVHLNNSVTRNHDWMLGTTLARVNCITHERGINDEYSELTRLFSRRLAVIICISNAVRERLEEQTVGRGNLVVIYNGVDPSKVSVKQAPSEIRRLYKIEADAPIVGIVGNIREWKGQHVVVSAIHALKGRYPRIRCLIVGDTARSDERYRDKLERLISEWDLSENVIFTEYQQDVPDYMNAMDVVIHASVRPEPFGRVLLEAMALAKPLIGSRSGAVPEIIEENNTGLMFEPGNADDLAQRIEVLLSDPEGARRMGKAGRRRLEEHFDIRRNVASTEALYERLLTN